MAEKRAAYEYYVPPELRPLARKVAPFVKGLNTGIAELAGFPVYLANLSPTLINLLPGKQGMKPFSEKPFGGAQTFKDLMAAGNIDTYKDLQSIPKDEYGAGVAGMLSGEALLSMFPVKRAVDTLMAGKKSKKNTLPALTAGGVDLSRRDFLKKAPVAVAATAMVPPVLREIGDVLPTGAAVKTAKVASKGSLGAAAGLSKKLKDFYRQQNIVFGEKEPFTESFEKSMIISGKMDEVTVALNKELDEFVKTMDLDKLSDKELLELARIKNQPSHSIRTGPGPDDFVFSGQPLRNKKVSEAIDEAVRARGLRKEVRDEFLDELMESVLRKQIKAGGGSSSDISLPSLPSEKIIKKMFPSGTTAKTTSLFPNEAKKGRQLLIVSCGSTKCPDVGNMKALDRYLGPIFQSIKKAGVPENVDVAILSAKHGLIRADTPIENYDQLMTKGRVNDFLKNNFEISKIRETMQGYDNVLVQGGENYKNVIKSAAGDIPYTEVPKGRGIGDQRSFVANYLKDQDKESIPDLGNSKAIKKGELLGGDQPQRFYHGTTREFEDFDPEFKVKTVAGRDFEGSSLENRGSYYFTTNPKSASTFAKSGIDPRTGEPFKSRDPNTGELMTGAVKGSRVIPVYLKNANYFDVDNADHLKTFKQSDFYKENKEKLNEKFKFLGADIDTLIKSGEETVIEEIIPELKKLGFEGHTTYLDGNKNIAVYDTDLIVSGVEKKAEGGIAGLSDVARDMFKGPKGIGAYQPFMVG